MITESQTSLTTDDDHPREACGVFGIYTPDREAARLTFFGLYALQHRGQESAGIATSDGQRACLHKGMGLVSQVFTEENLAPLTGHLAIGHTRYSTTGSSNLRNAQPYLIETLHGPLAVAHNGNLTNALDLRQLLLTRGVGLSSTTDSELITQILAAPPESWNGNGNGGNGKHPSEDRWIERIQALMRIAQGAYSLVLLTANAVYAVRDPFGMRPLCLGRVGDGYVVASETCALGTIGAEFVRQIEPGEIVRLDDRGVTSVVGLEAQARALCVFEYVYFARPDSDLEGQVIHRVRQQMGQQLAREVPVEADIVVPVPDSAIPAAIGYSLQSGIPFTEGLIKNRYIGRTFIQPDDALRKQGVRLKFNALGANLRGKRVILVDDSIVRGNTARPLVQLLRDGGATEVHVRVSSPPVRHPCFMGVDMATYTDLIAHRLKVDEIAQHIGADSLGYLSLEGMLDAIQATTGQRLGYCTACFSGNYPIDIPEWLFADSREKLIFEGVWR
ncbi:MAG: amidophosphoribosyltransferase [Chloroflexi bacterium]|nr:amidophosphoribosyltransferase [Chloroflexota bacterium]